MTGVFYEGDSYILLCTVKKGSSKQYNLHFWLGKDTSQDEAGTAAYKTVELDDQLGGCATQYREVQGSESPLFLSYFKKPIKGKGGNGIQYVPGGVSSGFKHVEQGVYRTRLLQVRGCRVTRVSEVPVSASSLTQSDAFILDLGLDIFVYYGARISMPSKYKANEIACAIDDDERGGKAVIYKIDDDPKNERFWDALGGYVDPKAVSPGISETEEAKFLNKLFCIDTIDSEVKFTEVDTNGGVLSRGMLQSGAMFLVHSVDALYIWVGGKASPAEKKEAMPFAVKYLKQNNLPSNMRIQKVAEGVEPSAFIKEFYRWTTTKEVAKKIDTPESPIDPTSFIGRIRRDELSVCLTLLFS